jgi:hypothetical protein
MVVDHIVKMVQFIPYNKSIIGEKATKVLFDHVFRYHGFPRDFNPDYGLQFASKFLKWFFKLLSVKMKLSSTFHS